MEWILSATDEKGSAAVKRLVRDFINAVDDAFVPSGDIDNYDDLLVVLLIEILSHASARQMALGFERSDIEKINEKVMEAVLNSLEGLRTDCLNEKKH